MDGKLDRMPAFLATHNIHVAILTETRRTLSHSLATAPTHIDGYTFYFSSHVDPTAASHFLDTRLREWGVCIAIKDGIAFQPVKVPPHFQARLLQGARTLRGPADSTLVLHLFALYAPANSIHKATFWTSLTDHLKLVAPTILSTPNHHIILGGDCNSYMDPSRDILRLNPISPHSSASPLSVSDGPPSTYLRRFIEALRDDSIPLYDPLSSSQYTAVSHHTYANSNFTYLSILDKIFTSFSTQHMEPTLILDWDQYAPVGLSDHRAALSIISLASLGSGWIEYPSTPFRSPPAINIDKLTSLDPLSISSAIASWKASLPLSIYISYSRLLTLLSLAPLLRMTCYLTCTATS